MDSHNTNTRAQKSALNSKKSDRQLFVYQITYVHRFGRVIHRFTVIDISGIRALKRCNADVDRRMFRLLKLEQFPLKEFSLFEEISHINKQTNTLNNEVIRH